MLLLLAALLVGVCEEGMFRAIGVSSVRRAGWTEGRVALWSTVAFRLAHLTNAIGGDNGAFAQAVTVPFAGYFFCLSRRVSRPNILNSVLHGLFDFTVITGTAIIPEGASPRPGTVLAFSAYLVCGIVLLVRRHKIELPEPAAVTADV